MVGKRLLTVLLCAVAPQVLAQWEVVKESPPDSDGEISVASVRNADGHGLKIYKALDGTVRGVFSISDGYDVLATETCPTFFVDDDTPQGVRFGETRCTIENKAAYFTLGREQAGSSPSAPLKRLMNGTAIVFRYHVDQMGYRETSFSLVRSKQALTSALGSDVNE